MDKLGLIETANGLTKAIGAWWYGHELTSNNGRV